MEEPLTSALPAEAFDELSMFLIIRATGVPTDLTTRERRLLVGALNFHALMAPGRTLTVHLYEGGWDEEPRTSDDSTFHGMSSAFAHRIGSIVIDSLVPSETREEVAGERDSLVLRSSAVRHVRISRDSVLDREPARDAPAAGYRRALRALRSRMPLLYNDLRDLELIRHRRYLKAPAPRRDYESEFDGVRARIVPAAPTTAGSRRAVIIGMHWFELGGAERWAFETVRLVREAGLIPVVITDRDSHQPWLGRAELDGAVILPLSFPTGRSQTHGVEELLRGILAAFDVRGVVVHHNQWLYDRLHWIARSRPNIPIVDSTHIVEYRGGGYPVSSALVEQAISYHHVISPSLASWMSNVQQIPSEKVVMAPLGGLTVQHADVSFRRRELGEPFTVAFVGRLARQKGPEVFLAAIRRLGQESTAMRFVMHGDGELAAWVERLIETAGLDAVIERRDSRSPVEDTLREAHLLVVSSHNEGLTLTTLEAIALGVPVISTRVGAQGDIIPSRALVPRRSRAAARGLARLIARLSANEVARERLWSEEREREGELLAHKPASTWFSEEISKW